MKNLQLTNLTLPEMKAYAKVYTLRKRVAAAKQECESRGISCGISSDGTTGQKGTAWTIIYGHESQRGYKTLQRVATHFLAVSAALKRAAYALAKV
jgi:hypothetical protein